MLAHVSGMKVFLNLILVELLSIPREESNLNSYGVIKSNSGSLKIRSTRKSDF